MNENISDNSHATEPMLQRLRELRRVLLSMHKTLLQDERTAYERLYGTVTSGELLQLVISDEQFAWLHSISELVVRIDETMDADEPATADELESLFAQTRTLLNPSETGSEFERKYHAAIQRDPDIVLAHREIKKLL